MYELSEVGFKFEQLYGVKITDEHAVLERPAVALYGLVYLPKTFIVSDIICYQVPFTSRHRYLVMKGT